MKIKDQGAKAKILECVSNDLSLKILAATMDEAKSAKDLCRELSTPKSSVYRSINALMKAGLLTIESQAPLKGRHELYRSATRGVTLEISPDSLEVTILQNRKVISKLIGLVKQLNR